MEIQTIALGNSSDEVEEFVTVPMEEQLTGIPGLDELRSKSVSQLSAIQLIFERGTDEMKARQLVQERLAQIAPNLPTWAAPPWMMPPLSATSRVMKIGLSSNDLNLIEMSSISYWKIRQRLLRVPGVAGVDIYGERLQQRHVQVDPAKLAENGVTLDQVKETASNAVDAGVLQYTNSFLVGTGGFVENQGQRLNIRNVQPIVSPQDLGKVPVIKRGNRVVRLSDLGRVREDNIPVWGEGVVNDGDGLLLIVQKFRGANTMEVTHGVDNAIDELRPGLPGMEIDPTIFRPATFIEQSIDNLTRAMLIGILLVILIIAAFLFTWRTAFISLIAIPLSLISAILVLDLRDVTINVMVLAGLVVAIGVVVDDAIIDVENIVRRLRQARTDGSDVSTFKIVLDASVEVRSAITYATVINVVAIVPVFFLEGLSGAFFQPLVLSYGLAVLVSMLVALTVTPALCLLMLSRGKLSQPGVPAPAGPEARLRRDPGAHHPPAQPGDHDRGRLPACRAPDLPDAREPAASELQGAGLPDALAHRAFHRRRRGEAHLGAGLQGPAGDPGGPQLRLPHRAGDGLGRDLRRLLRRELDQHQPRRGLRRHPGQGSQDGGGLSRPLPGRADLPARADQGGADRYERVDRRAHLRPGPAGPAREGGGGRGEDRQVSRARSTCRRTSPRTCPTSRCELNLAAARRYGLKPGDVRRQTSTILASEEVSDLFHEGKAYDVHVWSIPSARDSLSDVQRLAARHARRRSGPSRRRWPTSGLPRPRTTSSASSSRAGSTWARMWSEGHDLASTVEDVEERLRRSTCPPGTTPRCWASPRS